MTDPTLIAQADIKTLIASLSALTGTAGIIVLQIKQYFKNKNGNNPHSQKIDLLFGKFDKIDDKLDETKEEIKEEIHKVQMDVNLLKHDTKRMEETLSINNSAIQKIQIAHGRNHPENNKPAN